MPQPADALERICEFADVLSLGFVQLYGTAPALRSVVHSRLRIPSIIARCLLCCLALPCQEQLARPLCSPDPECVHCAAQQGLVQAQVLSRYP